MVFVCLSHFSWAAGQRLGENKTFDTLLTLSMLASPTFLLVSGITLGYIRTGSQASYAHFKAKLRERGILLLTVAHWAMVPSFYYMAPRAHEALRVLPITDTIGFCLLFGPLLVERLSPRRRIYTAVALLTVTWAVIFTWPSGGNDVVRAIEGAFFGTLTTPWWFYSFPVVPWFGVYVAGSVIGERISLDLHAKRRNFAWTFVKWAAGFTAVALSLEVASLVVTSLTPLDRHFAAGVEALSTPFRKYPPSIAYLLVYGAVGLLMAAVTARLVEDRRLQWLTNRAAEIGRASLPVFVVQSYLYYFIELHWLPPTRYWPLSFLGSLLLVYLTARLWLAAGGNNLLRIPRWGGHRLVAAKSPPE
jgi:hypothetical protein